MINTDLIKNFEGCKLKAYVCPAKVVTVGFGTTFYENKEPVKIDDMITQERANELLDWYVNTYCLPVIENSVNKPLEDNQLSALCSFIYNVGNAAFKSSTLLKKININPNDPSIEAEFMKWTKANKVELKGLVKRRQAEANLYFNKQ